MEKTSFLNFSWQVLWRLFVFGLIIVTLYLTKEVIGVLLVSIVISLGLEPLINFFESKRIPRILGIIIIFFLFLLIISFCFYLISSILINELTIFIKHFSKAIYSIFGFNLSTNELLKIFQGDLLKIFDVFKNNNSLSIKNTFSTIINDIVLIISIILISFYLILEKNGIDNFLKSILPDAYEKQILKIFENFKSKIRKWFVAQIILSSSVGLLTFFGLLILGARYPLLIGVLAAIFEIVPVIGPILVGFIAFLLSLSDSLLFGLYVLLFFFLVQQFESHILTPLVIGKTMKLHPVLVIVSILAGAKLAGIFGVILAVPLAIFLEEIFIMFSENKIKRINLGI